MTSNELLLACILMGFIVGCARTSPTSPQEVGANPNLSKDQRVSLSLEPSTNGEAVILTVKNVSAHALALPMMLEPFRSVFFEEETRKGRSRCNLDRIIEPPYKNILVLEKVGPGRLIKTSLKFSYFTVTPISEIIAIRATLRIPTQRNSIEDARPWEGTIVSEWCKVGR